MTKFSVRSDPGYKKVLNAIETLLEESLTDDKSAPVKESTYAIGINRTLMEITVSLYSCRTTEGSQSTHFD